MIKSTGGVGVLDIPNETKLCCFLTLCVDFFMYLCCFVVVYLNQVVDNAKYQISFSTVMIIAWPNDGQPPEEGMQCYSSKAASFLARYKAKASQQYRGQPPQRAWRQGAAVGGCGLELGKIIRRMRTFPTSRVTVCLLSNIYPKN